jgi:NADPH:quinone reductase-like Zn-dependent oxidoreductase
MRAVVLTGHGGRERLVLEKAWPVPAVGAGQVLVQVAACGLNNTDINTRVGWYARGSSATGRQADTVGHDGGGWRGAVLFPRIQGGDVCGQVVALGDGVDGDLLDRRVIVDPWLRDWSAPDVLDRCGVLGSERDGGFAEYMSVPWQNVHAVSSSLSDVELASFPMASITAANMLDRAALAEGESVIVTGASGGVGSALVQLAHGRRATVIAACGDDKVDHVRRLGAAAIVARDLHDLPARVRAATGRETVDAVMDLVGGPEWVRLIVALRAGGRYCCAGAVAGPSVELDLRTLYLHDLALLGATVPPPHLFAELVSSIENGQITPVVAATFPLDQLPAAQEMFSAKRYVGNIVIDVRAPVAA